MARRYPVFFQDEQIVWRKTFYSDVTNETPVDPSSVVFKLLSPIGTVVSPTVVNEPSTGIFSASHVVDSYGIWQWRWETSNPVIVDQGAIDVKESNVP
jgi:hypothetical protein